MAFDNDKETPRAGWLYESTTVLNVSDKGRMLSAAAGASLLMLGLCSLRRKPLGSAAQLLAGGYLLYRGLSGNCPVKALVEKQAYPRHARAVNIRTAVYVKAPLQQVYDYWRKVENLPGFMSHLHKVTALSDTHSHWKIKLVGGITLSWDAEIVDEKPYEFFGWRSLQGADIANAGKLTFRELPDGMTEVNVLITYRPPAGYAGETLAHLLNPAFAKLVRRDVKHFKQHVEDVFS
ncbi:SRPBCC family protein [Chitinophaga lutea]